jgi:MATE family, multidrug efflux pump
MRSEAAPERQAAAAPSARHFEVTHKGVLAIALPMTLAYLSTPLLGAVNTAVIGRLGDAALLGGLAIGAIIFDVVFTTFNFLRSGTTGLTAQAYGANDAPELQAVFWRALILALVAGLVVVALHNLILTTSFAFIGGSESVRDATATYYGIRVLATPLALANYVILGWLIGRGRALLALVLQSVLNGINVVLSIAFVSGLGLGVGGVAWAAVTAETATAALGIVVVFHISTTAQFDPARVLNLKPFRRMLSVNGDIMIRSFALLFAFAFFTSRSAAESDVVLAANQVLITLFFVGSYFLDGLATAAEQFAGRAVGARYRPAFERSLVLTIAWGYAVAVALSAVLWIAGPSIIAAMTTNEGVRATALAYLPYAALTPLVGTLAFQMDGVFIGATWSRDMRNMMLLSVAVYLAAWWIMAPFLGVDGLWMALLIFLGVRGVALLLICARRVGPAFAETDARLAAE